MMEIETRSRGQIGRIGSGWTITITDVASNIEISLPVTIAELEQWQGEIDCTIGYADREDE